MVDGWLSKVQGQLVISFPVVWLPFVEMFQTRSLQEGDSRKKPAWGLETPSRQEQVTAATGLNMSFLQLNPDFRELD